MPKSPFLQYFLAFYAHSTTSPSLGTSTGSANNDSKNVISIWLKLLEENRSPALVPASLKSSTVCCTPAPLSTACSTDQKWCKRLICCTKI